MRGSGVILTALVTLSSAALIYHRAHPAIETQWVTYTSGAEEVRAFAVMPQSGGVSPAIIAIHEWWGVNDWVQQNAKKLAKEGYLVLAIDLYRGEVTADQETAHQLMRGLPEDRALRDLQAAFAYLQSRDDVDKSRIGSIGWRMGGSYSLQAAVHLPELAACVINYGRLVTEAEAIAQIKAPVLGIFGGLDRGIPVKDVRAFEKQAQRSDKNLTIEIYSKSGHGFINENNARAYNAKDAAAAWEKTFAFFAEHLK